jgi:hypothetical protein
MSQVHVLIKGRVSSVLELIDDLLDGWRALRDQGLPRVCHGSTANLSIEPRTDFRWLTGGLQSKDVLKYYKGIKS